MSPAAKFPSLHTTKMRKVLRRLGYQEVPGTRVGSHVWLEAEGRPRIRWAFHDRELSSIEVRNVLLKQAGLSLRKALEVTQRV